LKCDGPSFFILLYKLKCNRSHSNTNRRSFTMFKVYHALTVYAMRPNPSSAAELDEIMREIIPATLDPETSLGLPIRGTPPSVGIVD